MNGAARLQFEERVGPGPTAWIWLVVIVVITFLAIAPVVVPIAALAWLVNVLRYRESRVQIGLAPR